MDPSASDASPAGAPLLAVRDLRIDFLTDAGPRTAVDEISFTVSPGRVLALVGESGSGKSVTAMSLLGLLPPTATTRGSAVLGGTELVGAAPATLRSVRGRRVGAVFQDPFTTFNPVLRVGTQIAEALRAHAGKIDGREADERVLTLLSKAGLRDPRRISRSFPHELSGGQLQRAMIAMAISGQPDLLIADEPTTALDVTVQAGILDLLHELRRNMGTAILLITHDMGVVADMADAVAVMYAGRVVESGPVEAIFAAPRHPYTRLLLATLPRLDGPPRTELPTIAGTVPDPHDWPSGCHFRTRCPLADASCLETPPLTPPPDAAGTMPDHLAACWHADRVGALA